MMDVRMEEWRDGRKEGWVDLDIVLEGVGHQGLAEEGGHTGQHPRPWAQ